MRDELEAKSPAGLGDRSNFVGCERCHSSRRAHYEIVTGDVQLDDIHALTKADADGASCFDRTIENHSGGATALVDLGRVVEAAGGRQSR